MESEDGAVEGNGSPLVSMANNPGQACNRRRSWRHGVPHPVRRAPIPCRGASHCDFSRARVVNSSASICCPDQLSLAILPGQ